MLRRMLGNAASGEDGGEEEPISKSEQLRWRMDWLGYRNRGEVGGLEDWRGGEPHAKLGCTRIANPSRQPSSTRIWTCG